MASNSGSNRPAWGPKKSWAATPSTSSSASSAPSSRDATPSSSSSAFPPLSSPQARRPTSRTNSPFSSVDSSLISSSSFNPYPTRRQELAQRAASHGTRKRSHITRSDPSTSRIHSLLDYDDDDVIMHDQGDDEEEGEVSSRGATMSSIVFRDLSASASTSRSASPWQQGGLSPGLAMFASSSFGGEPLRVLANVDEELGAAHMGPRIYRRHNQKHVRNKVRAKIGASHSAGLVADERTEMNGEKGRKVGAATVGDAEMTEEEKQRLKGLDLQKLVNECRRRQNVVAVQSRVNGEGGSSDVYQSQAVQTLLSAIRVRIADPHTWTGPTSNVVISDDLLPGGLSQQQVDFSALPPSLLFQLRKAVLQGLDLLLDTIAQSTHQNLVSILPQLLSLPSLRPTATITADLKPDSQRTFLHILTTISSSTTSPVELLSSVLTSTNQLSDPLTSLIGELIGLCGQQMSSNPSILTEHQDATLVSACSFLSLCFLLNSTRPSATRLPTHAFYCTVLDLAPFLEHFVHHAASTVRTSAAAGMARFNMCRWPFLLSLGAKVRILQLENEIRLGRRSPREAVGGQRFTLASQQNAELVVQPTSLSLKIDRSQVWQQSKGLLLQLLEASTPPRGLRVEFAGEQAADGGGPTREWFAIVASTWAEHRDVVGPHGWLIASESADEDTAAFLGLLLALAALHTTKLALPFTLPPAAFKIATAPDLELLELTPVDLEPVDPALAKSLQSVLDWSAGGDEEFEGTFSLTWSTSIRTSSGEVQTIDLVPGGRHRSVKLEERHEFVSKLIFRVLVGSVKKQVVAFRDAWQTVMPCLSAGGSETATEVIGRGGLAMSLFSAEEVAQAVLAVPSSSDACSTPLDVDDIRGSTEIVSPNNAEVGQVVNWFWTTWSGLDAVRQRRLLAFITGAEDLPATGARGVGLRIHLVATSVAEDDARSWPLPWSSTCTSTLFLPAYPTQPLLQSKVGIAIEHYQGFGLR